MQIPVVMVFDRKGNFMTVEMKEIKALKVVEEIGGLKDEKEKVQTEQS